MDKEEKEKILDEIFIPREEVIEMEVDRRIKNYRKLEIENESLKKYVDDLKAIFLNDLTIVADTFRETTKTKEQEKLLVPLYWKIHRRIMKRIDPMSFNSQSNENKNKEAI